MDVKVVTDEGVELPQYKTAGAAGFDLAAKHYVAIMPRSRATIHTGLYFEIPEGFELQIRSRSGLAAKSGIKVLNSPGTIDSDYRGEVMVILYNSTDQGFVVKPGDRIAQAVLAKYERANLVQADKLSETERGEGGLGHTGV